jgi:hypothetical protein
MDGIVGFDRLGFRVPDGLDELSSATIGIPPPSWNDPPVLVGTGFGFGDMFHSQC